MNPLKEKQKTMSFAEMSRLTGLHRNTLLNISRYNDKQILGMQLKTILLLEEKLDVLIAENIKY